MLHYMFAVNAYLSFLFLISDGVPKPDIGRCLNQGFASGGNLTSKPVVAMMAF